jgi:hypothetical protein
MLDVRMNFRANGTRFGRPKKVCDTTHVSMAKWKYPLVAG